MLIFVRGFIVSLIMAKIPDKLSLGAAFQALANLCLPLQGKRSSPPVPQKMRSKFLLQSAALNRFQELTAKLSRAFALASASEYAREVKEEVGFFQAVKAGLTKTAPKSGLNDREK